MSALDTSESTGKEKAASAAKTSLVMLGAIGAAAVAAHKFWPKGVTYGDKDDWEMEKKKEREEDKEKLRAKLREGRDALEGSRSSGRRGGSRDRDRDRYLQDRRRERPRLPRSMGGGGGDAFWDRRARMPSRGRYVAAYDDDDGYVPDPRYQPRRVEAAPLPLPPPPPAPAPPRSFADSAPLVVPAGASRRELESRGPGRGRYYIDKETIMVPSSGEKAYIIQRDAPPGQRLRERERDQDAGYYR